MDNNSEYFVELHLSKPKRHDFNVTYTTLREADFIARNLISSHKPDSVLKIADKIIASRISLGMKSRLMDIIESYGATISEYLKDGVPLVVLSYMKIKMPDHSYELIKTAGDKALAIPNGNVVKALNSYSNTITGELRHPNYNQDILRKINNDKDLYSEINMRLKMIDAHL